MSKHQIIYTSCMRGINSVNDGQQIYSYDASFSDSMSDDVKGLFTYQVPSLEPGVIMTEELAETMPQAFTYRRLGNGSCAIALNTYLGRDYMGSAGRFGNHLSHAVICDESEMTSYPCEFFGGELLRSRMESSEVNGPDKPPFLPEPVLKKGYRIDTENITDFLNIDNRMDIFKKMFAAMLAFESARKRIVICDDPENIVMWIAALQYALPLKMALNVNFTTYEFDPSLSASQICGVIPSGSRYTTSNASKHFTFDYFQGIIPEIEVDGGFFDFIDMGMSLSYESLQAFHEFVSTKLTYEKADEQYYNAYSLYCLFLDGLENLSLDAFKHAVQLADDYAHESEILALIKKLLEEKDLILSLDETYSFEIIRVLLTNIIRLSVASQEQVKKLIVEKAIATLTSSNVNETRFNKFYHELDVLCGEVGISIPSELMKEANRNTLLASMQNDNNAWKWKFIVNILCEYILLEHVPADQLSMDYQIGHLISGIIQSLVTLDANQGFTIIMRIIDRFSEEWKYLVNIALNIEGMLYDIQHSERITAALWQYFYQTVAKKQTGNRQNIYAFFMQYDRCDQVFGIYDESLGVARSSKEARNLFREQINFDGTKYYQIYGSKIFEFYYGYLQSSKDTDTGSAKGDLLQTIIRKSIVTSFVDELIDSVIANIPLAAPSRENEKLLVIVVEYYAKKRDCIFSGRLLLLVSGMLLSKIQNKSDLDSAIKALRGSITKDRINMSSSNKDAKKYLDWIVPKVFAACESANDLLVSYDLFKFSRSSFDLFVALCGKEAIKECKGDKDFYSIIVFLGFLFSVGGVDKKKIGKLLSKLSKQKLESLDLVVTSEFSGKRKYLSLWEEIREIAASTNPLLNSLGNLFRRNDNV